MFDRGGWFGWEFTENREDRGVNYALSLWHINMGNTRRGCGRHFNILIQNFLLQPCNHVWKHLQGLTCYQLLREQVSSLIRAVRTTKKWWREVSSQMSNCVRLRFFSSCCWALTTFVANHRRTIVSRLVGDQFLFAIVRHRLRSGSSKLSRLLPDVCTHYWSPTIFKESVPAWIGNHEWFLQSVYRHRCYGVWKCW